MKSLFMKIIRYILFIFRKIESLLHSIKLSLIKLQFRSYGQETDFGKCVLFKGRNFISIGSNCFIDDFSVITAWPDYRGQHLSPSLSIGNDCHIGAYNHITAIKNIMIGDGVLTGKWVTITDNSHGLLIPEQMHIPPAFRPLHSKGEVIIEKNVWICDKVTITAGVSIGEGCVIAANAVVTKSVPPYSLVAGNPAKVIKSLYKL